MTPLPSLTLKDIRVYRGNKRVLNNISFHLDAGESLHITGPNGVGKSTLLRTIAQLCPIASGTLQHNHLSLGWLGPQDALKPQLTIRENLSLLRTPHSDHLEEILSYLSLSPFIETTVRQLSSGQKRRVSLARLYLEHASLWLLDEPTTSLDTIGRAQLEHLIQHHRRKNGIVIFTSHTPLHVPHTRCLHVSASSHKSTPIW